MSTTLAAHATTARVDHRFAVITQSSKEGGADVVVTGTHRDHDTHKGAMEEDRPGPERPDAPALDGDGLPNDETAIAQDALGAVVDQSQG